MHRHDLYDQVGTEVAVILQRTYDAVSALRAEARLEPDRLRVEANRMVIDLRTQAERYAAQVHDEADAYARTVRAEAEGYALEIRRQARVAAEQQAELNRSLIGCWSALTDRIAGVAEQPPPGPHPRRRVPQPAPGIQRPGPTGRAAVGPAPFSGGLFAEGPSPR